MELKAKTFDELTTAELYEIIKARTAVFVVEQHIICQDLDGIDYNSLHCFFIENGAVTAYLRAFYDNSVEDAVRIGRVLTLHHGKGLGAELMAKSLEVIQECMPCRKIILDAQKYAVGFYEKFGFEVASDDFLEEGIVHVVMQLDLQMRFNLRDLR